MRQKGRGKYHDQHQHEGGGERTSPMSRVLVVLCLLAQRGWLVQPDHMRKGLHLIKSRMYWNVESIVEGIVIRVVNSSCRLHGLSLLANVLLKDSAGRYSREEQRSCRIVI